MSFFEELRRRNVVRVGVAYIIGAWITIQLTDVLISNIGAPDWVFKAVLILLAVGLMLALFVAWAFELTPEGIKREVEVDRAESITPKTARKIDRVIIGLLLAAVLVLLLDKFYLSTPAPTQAIDAAPGEELAARAETYDSIGVLPFANITNDPEQEYFSDGIAEELLNALAKIRNLKVAARTSSFSLKGQNLNAIEIGEQLRVGTVLEGSVRKAGNRIRITAQLIDAANGYHLWSETYDRELTDVFAVQDEITAAIVSALAVHLDTGEEISAGGRGGGNVEAYEKYLQGKHVERKGRASREALDLFREATELDPEFAPAWAARARAVIDLRETAFWGEIPPEDAHMLAQNSIERALAIDPRQAEAYVARGMLLADQFEYDGALENLEQAVELNPSLAEAWTWLGRIQYRFGRIQEARASMLKALDLDPLHGRTAFFASSLATEYYDPAYFNQVLERVQPFPEMVEQLKDYLLLLTPVTSAQIYQELREELANPRKALQLDVFALKKIDESTLAAGARYPREILMWVYIGINQGDKALEIYQSLPEERKRADINLEELSILQTRLGQCEAAIAGLDQAHDGDIRIYGLVEPNMDRSNSNLALNRAFCLRQLGREAEAAEVISRVETFVETLRANADQGYAQVEAKLLALQGKSELAMDVLERAVERVELDWATRYDPVLATLSDNPRFVALFESLDQRINSVRAELGMPPAPF